MIRLAFYVQYAARNLWRNRRWSAFAMLSVAAGVATMVALRTLGLAIGDSLTSNVRSANHGDITLERGSSFVSFDLGETQDSDVFATQQVRMVEDWTQDRGGLMSAYKTVSLQVTPVDRSGVGLLNFMTAFIIDPATYPPTQDIVASQPRSVPLGDLFTGDDLEIVISDNLASAQRLGVGDRVRVSGTTETFVVRGIVPTEAEAGLRSLFAAFFGFVYFDQAQAASALTVDMRPNRISIALPDGTSNDEILDAAGELNRMLRPSGWLRTLTVPRILEQNEIIADVTGRFVVVMGLGAMLIGGVGIINTMLVMVRRRTEEIAALKTFGLKGRQVAALFMTEALLLGIVGSAVGSVIGALLSRLTNAYGETFIQQPLGWRLYPEALLFGMVLGVVVTAVFGVMPVLTAVRVRPATILRPNETHIPALGVVQSFLVMLFVVFSLGLIAGQIIGPLPEGIPWLDWMPLPPHLALGVVGVTITLLFLGLLVMLLWVVVWIVGRLPAFGSVDLRLALRNLSTRRLRTATTLLAISTGMFALSSITFYGAGVREILQFTLTETFGGNILIVSPASFSDIPGVANIAQQNLDNTLRDLDGVVYRTRLSSYSLRLAGVDGSNVSESANAARRAELVNELRQAQQENDFQTAAQVSQQLQGLREWVNVAVRDTDNPRFINPAAIVAGRGLRLDDRGQMVAVITDSPAMQMMGVGVGSTITLQHNNRSFVYEVVGISEAAEEGGFQGGFPTDIQVPPETLIGVSSSFRLNTVQATPDKMEDVMLAISAMPAFFPINVAFIDGLIGRIIDQFSALPILVGLLSLGAAAVIMANTVALATLERRRQIGILKAVGLKSRRVLAIMLLENTLISLLGGVIGIGLSALGVALLSFFGLDDLVLIPASAQPVAVALVVAAVAIGAAATFLSANVAVRERVLNVLRYE